MAILSKINCFVCRFIASLLLLFVVLIAYGQTITAYVGQEFKLYVPSPQYPYLYPMAANWFTDQAPNIVKLNGDEYDATFKITSEFSGTQMIECWYTWMNFSKRGAPHASPILIKKFYIKCSGGGSGGNGGGSGGNGGGTEGMGKLPSAITLGVGQEFDLTPFLTESVHIYSSNTTVAGLKAPATVFGKSPGTSLLTFMGSTVYGCNVTVSEPDMAFVVWTTDGLSNTFSFDERPNVTFTETEITVRTLLHTLKYAWDKVDRFSFVDLSIDETPVNVQTSISVEPRSMTIEVGNTIRLSASAEPASLQQYLQWSSEKPNIASVDVDGTVSAIGVGETWIKATAINTADSCKIKVVPPQPTGITITPEEITMNIGEKRQFDYTLTPQNAVTTLKWTTSNASVATVSDMGLVSAIGGGNAVITISTDNGYMSQGTVIVNMPDGVILQENERVTIHRQHGRVILSGCGIGEIVEVYSVTGLVLRQTADETGTAVIELSGQGIYIIKTGSTIVKVITK